MPDEVLLPDTARAPRFYPVDIPGAPYFHPELGYLAPSHWLWRKLRVAAAVALVGSAIAAGTALALMPSGVVQRVSDPQPQVAVVSPPAPIDQAVPAMPAPPTVQLPARAQGVCDDLSTAFLALECRSGRIGKARLARARATHRLATVTIGRADPETAVPQAEKAAPAAPKPSPAAVPAKPKPPVRTARRERPSQIAAEPATPQVNSGGLAFPRFVLPSLFGGANLARSW